MFSLWVVYAEILPFLPWLALAFTLLLVLLVARPFFLFYFKINSTLKLLREQVRLEKKILEELQLLRFSVRQKGNSLICKQDSHSPLEEAKKVTDHLNGMKEELIKIELK